MKFRLALLGLTLFAAGCGADGPQLTDVEGALTLDGKPVPNAELVFIPQDVPVRSPSYGLTDDNGHFVLKFTMQKFGAMPAKHHVQVDIPKGSDEDRQAGKAFKLPKKYVKDGSLTADVKEGKNFIELKLTTD